MKRFLFTMSDNALLVGLLSRLRKGGRENTLPFLFAKCMFLYINITDSVREMGVW